MNTEIKSVYYDKFKKLSKKALDKFTLRGNLIIVEKLQFEKKTKSGIIVDAGEDKGIFRTMHENSLEFHIVSTVGSGYEDEDGNDDPSLLECKAGDIVVLPQGSVNYLPYFGTSTIETKGQDRVGIARSSDCFIVFDGIKGFEQFFSELES